MVVRLVVDEAGRIVLPQLLREELSLEPGDSLELESTGDQIHLRPVREDGRIVMEHGIPVFRGSGRVISLEETNKILEDIYLERERSFLGLGE